MVKKGIEMFWKSEKIEAMVNDFAASVAAFQGTQHRSCDTSFLGFNVEKTNDGSIYVYAVYEADGYNIVVWWDGDWFVEDTDWVKVALPL